jgi:hypothetical protein
LFKFRYTINMPARRSPSSQVRTATPRTSRPDEPQEWPEWLLRLRQRVWEEGQVKREWAEKAGNLVLQLMDLSEESLVDAATAPDNFHAMLRAMGSPELLEQMQASDPLARAFLNGLDARAQLIEQNGGVFKTEQVSDYLGISPQAVNKRRSSFQLLGLTFRRRGHVFPAWQFDQRGTIAGLQEVLLALSEHDEWMQNVFFVSPNTRLGGRRPLDLLRDKKITEVIEAAKDFSQHGAA